MNTQKTLMDQDQTFDELLKACKSLVNNLPDFVLDLARDSIGNSNVSAIYEARTRAKSIINRIESRSEND